MSAVTETHVTITVDADGACEYQPQRPGRLERLFVASPRGGVGDALFNLAVLRDGRVIGSVEGAHVQGFPLRLTVMWDTGDLVAIRFNPRIVKEGAQVTLFVDHLS